jgi:hypothetical protein
MEGRRSHIRGTLTTWSLHPSTSGGYWTAQENNGLWSGLWATPLCWFALMREGKMRRGGWVLAFSSDIPLQRHGPPKEGGSPWFLLPVPCCSDGKTFETEEDEKQETASLSLSRQDESPAATDRLPVMTGYQPRSRWDHPDAEGVCGASGSRKRWRNKTMEVVRPGLLPLTKWGLSILYCKGMPRTRG